MHEPFSAAIEQRTRRKNADRPRGRRALLWAVGLFVLSQGALGFLLANDGFVIRDPIRHGRLQILCARMAEAPSAPKVVVLLGSSHVEAGLRALQMSREVSASLGQPVVVANRGVLGGGALRSLLTLDRLIREGIAPDLVVLETFPSLFSVSHPFDDATEEMLPSNWLDEEDVGLLRRYAVERPNLGARGVLDKLTPGYKVRANLCNYLKPWLRPSARLRQLPLEEVDVGVHSTERRAKGMALARKSYFPILQNLTLGEPRQVRAVDELVGILRARGVKVVFLATPEGPAFRSWYPADRWAQSVVWLRELADRHGVPMIDAREWSDREDWFIDSHHLSQEGSEEFSRWLGREVLVPHSRAEQ